MISDRPTVALSAQYKTTLLNSDASEVRSGAILQQTTSILR